MSMPFPVLRFVVVCGVLAGSMGPTWASTEASDARTLGDTAGEYPSTSAAAPADMPVAQPPPKPATTPAVAAKPSPDAKPKAQLAGSTWELTLNPMATAAEGAKKKRGPLQDTLQFGEGGTIASQRLGGQGYPVSHYTVTVAADGTITWETMQTSEKAGVVFWRGDIQGETMQGVYSHRPVEGEASDYFFNGRKVATPPPAAAVAPVPATAVVTVPAVPATPVAVQAAPAAPKTTAPDPAPRKRKKWW